MCESVEKFAKEVAEEYADECTTSNVKSLMDNLKLSLDQALNALNIQGDSRAHIIKQLQK